MAVNGIEEKIFLTKILQNYTLAPAKDDVPSIPGARSSPGAFLGIRITKADTPECQSTASCTRCVQSSSCAPQAGFRCA